MWFRNLQIYRLPRPWTITADQLRNQLGRGIHRAPAGHEAQARGWVSPRNDGDLLHVANGQWLIRLRIETRLLPASVINDEVKKRAEALADVQGFGPGRKQLRELRERVTNELLPRSHPVAKMIWAWIDPQAGLLCIDAANEGKAGLLIEHLRHCLDNFPVLPLHTALSPSSAMADWLAGGEAPNGFSIDHDCELKGVGDNKASVRYTRHALADQWADEVKTHLGAGQLPTKLALTWDDRVSFVLTDKLDIRRLAFLDLLKEEAEQHAEHAEEQFDADFAIMTGELGRFLKALVMSLGGEKIDG